MNNADRLFAQREWLNYARFRKEGCTYPNALGYGSSTPIGTLMSGESGSTTIKGAKIPSKFNYDSTVDICQRVFWNLPQFARDAITGVYMYRWTEQRTADLMGVSRHVVRKGLNHAYVDLIEAIQPRNKHQKMLSG